MASTLFGGGVMPLAACGESEMSGDTGGADGGGDPYRELDTALQTLSDPWEGTATEVAEQMVEQMRAEAVDLVESVVNPLGIPGDEMIDIVLAFKVGASLMQAGGGSLNRETYRNKVNNAHDDFTKSLYDALPHTSYDAERPNYTLIVGASGAVQDYMDDRITEDELASRFATIDSIFGQIWSSVERAKDATVDSWTPDAEHCITIDGEEHCGKPNGDPYYNSLQLARHLVKHVP